MDNTNVSEEAIQKVSLVAGCVIKRDNLYLLVQENTGKAEGLWNIPAGHVDIGETFEATAKREVKEETGYDVQVGESIGIWQATADRSVSHAYYAEIVGGELIPNSDEIRQATWISYDQITELNSNEKIRAPWVFDAISRVEKGAQVVQAEASETKQRHFLAAFFLSLTFGVFGADRFYLGKTWTAILKLLTAGGFGIWAIVDLATITSGNMRDKQGNVLLQAAEYKKLALKTTFIITTIGIIILAALVISSVYAVTQFMNSGDVKDIITNLTGGSQSTDINSLLQGL